MAKIPPFSRQLFSEMDIDAQLELLTFLMLGIMLIVTTGSRKARDSMVAYLRDADISAMKPQGQRIVRGLVEITESIKPNRPKAKKV